MTELPDLLFVIDSNKESIAVKEAASWHPGGWVVDTNCDPDEVTWPIPGNDDALRAIRLFTNKIADAWSKDARSPASRIRSQGIGHHRRGPGRGHVAVRALCRPAVERGCAHRGISDIDLLPCRCRKASRMPRRPPRNSCCTGGRPARRPWFERRLRPAALDGHSNA